MNRRAVIVSLVLVVLALAGCGTDDHFAANPPSAGGPTGSAVKSPTTATTPTTTSTPTTVAPTTTIPATTTTSTTLSANIVAEFLDQACVDTAILCVDNTTETKGLARVGLAICMSLESGNSVKQIVNTEEGSILNAGVSTKDAQEATAAVLASAVEYLCPKYQPALNRFGD